MDPLVTCHTRQTCCDGNDRLLAGPIFVLVIQLKVNRRWKYCRSEHCQVRSIFFRCKRNVFTFEYFRCTTVRVGLKETRRNQTHWPWFRFSPHLLSVRIQTHTHTHRHTLVQWHHSIAALEIFCTWHLPIDPYVNAQSAYVCVCLSMYSGHENRIPHFVLSFILVSTMQCALCTVPVHHIRHEQPIFS